MSYLRGARVLVVDDEADVCIALKDLLETEMEAKVWLAHSAADALELLESTEVDVLITDYRMPGGDGLQLAETVRLTYPRVRCVMVTAFDRDLMRALGGRPPPMRVLHKPLEPSDILDEVHRASPT